MCLLIGIESFVIEEVQRVQDSRMTEWDRFSKSKDGIANQKKVIYLVMFVENKMPHWFLGSSGDVLFWVRVVDMDNFTDGRPAGLGRGREHVCDFL